MKIHKKNNKMYSDDIQRRKCQILTHELLILINFMIFLFFGIEMNSLKPNGSLAKFKQMEDWEFFILTFFAGVFFLPLYQLSQLFLLSLTTNLFRFNFCYLLSVFFKIILLMKKEKKREIHSIFASFVRCTRSQ